jgi:hypothetical protein
MCIAWTLSPYMETACWTTIQYTTTTICESFFHWMKKMMPKCYSWSSERFRLKLAAAFIIFVRRREAKSRIKNRKLTYNKSVGGLVVGAAQTHGMVERWLGEFLRDVLPWDAFTHNAAALCDIKANQKDARRLKHDEKILALAASSELLQATGLGAGLSDQRTSIAGTVSSEQKISPYTWSQPPFPFKAELIELTTVQKINRAAVFQSTKDLQKRKLASATDNPSAHGDSTSPSAFASSSGLTALIKYGADGREDECGICHLECVDEGTVAIVDCYCCSRRAHSLCLVEDDTPEYTHWGSFASSPSGEETTIAVDKSGDSDDYNSEIEEDDDDGGGALRVTANTNVTLFFCAACIKEHNITWCFPCATPS